MSCIKGIFFLLFSIRCFASIPLINTSEKWHTDLNLAQEEAQTQNCPLLVAFLGPDWCVCSDKLEEEILMSRPFLAALGKQLVLLRVDLSKEFDQENPQITALKEKYQIKKCPSLILTEASGQEIAKLECLPLKDKEFALYIKEIISNYYKVDTLAKKKQFKHLKIEELKSLYAQSVKFANSSYKKALLKEGLKSDRSPYFLIEQYGQILNKGKFKTARLRSMRKKIIARDVDNQQGFRRQMAMMDFEALVNVAHCKKTQTVVKPLVDYLQNFGEKDPENAWKIELKISRYFFSKDQVEEALKHATASLKIAPDAAQNEIFKSIEYLKTFLP